MITAFGDTEIRKISYDTEIRKISYDYLQMNPGLLRFLNPWVIVALNCDNVTGS